MFLNHTTNPNGDAIWELMADNGEPIADAEAVIDGDTVLIMRIATASQE